MRLKIAMSRSRSSRASISNVTQSAMIAEEIRCQFICTFPELSASCDSAHEALNEPADFWAQAPY